MPGWRYQWEKALVSVKESFNVTLYSHQRPNFTVEVIQMDIANVDYLGQGSAGWIYAPSFIQFPPSLAKKNRWVKDYNEYYVLAASVFALQYPNHDFSRWFHTFFGLTEKQRSMLHAGRLRHEFKMPDPFPYQESPGSKEETGLEQE